MTASPTESPFANVIGLGKLLAEYKPRNVGKWIGPVMGGGLMLATPVLCMVTAYVAYGTYTSYGINRGLEEAVFPAICAAISFGLGALVLWEAWNNWGIAAALYEHGLAYTDRHGLQQILWNDVEQVWMAVTKHYRNGIYTGTTHLYTLQLREGKKIKLDDKLANVEQLGNDVLKHTTNTLFPRYWQAVQNGQRVTFGPLALDMKGLYAGKKEVAWQDIKAVKLARGELSVQKEKGWFSWTSASVPQIPNFYIFYELVGRFTKIE